MPTHRSSQRIRLEVEALEEKVLPSTVLSQHHPAAAHHATANNVALYNGVYNITLMVKLQGHLEKATGSLTIAKGVVFVGGQHVGTVSAKGAVVINATSPHGSVHLHGQITLAHGGATITGSFTLIGGFTASDQGPPRSGTFTGVRH